MCGMYTFVHACLHGWDTCMGGSIRSLSTITLPWRCPLLNTALFHSASLAGQLAPQGQSLPLKHRDYWGGGATSSCPAFYVATVDLNLDSHVFMKALYP